MCHNPIFCVIPPHILTAMINRGNKHHKKWALNTLSHTQRLRGHREILSRYDLTDKDSGKFRIVTSAGDTQNIIGKVIRKEGQSLTGDPAVDEAYAFTGYVYDFYFDVFKRNSIDNAGMQLLSTVHFGNNFDNAFWNGERMVFGDGDGRVFQRFTKCPEVIGHEMTHGVTETSSHLSYIGQSGAMNEAISDVFGSLIKQKVLNQTADQADWVIGQGLFEPSIKGVGVRNLKAPGTAYDDPILGKDPCPASMTDYVKTNTDNGGIHINTTIASHAFYISAIELGGHAWQKPGRVWYNAVTNRLGETVTFVEFANMTMKVASRIFGKGSLELQAVRKGWQEVKVF